jgi:hypothetical protein
MRAIHVVRGGTYFRVCDPLWKNPADTAFSKAAGGRWNPPGEFGALYLCADVLVAAGNARRSIAREFGDAVTFADLRSDRRPQLQAFSVTRWRFVDAVTERGIAALSLPKSFPDASHRVCRRVARVVFENGEPGIAARSAVAPGEELAVFDGHLRLVRRKPHGRVPFEEWYPGLV